MKNNSLKYLILLFVIYGCSENIRPDNSEHQPLYSEPLSVPLNLSEGYKTNLLTGDSIKPFSTTSGDTFKTGVPVPLFSKTIGNEIFQPKIIEGVQTIKTIIKDNVYPVLDKPFFVKIDTSKLKKIKLGEGDLSHVIKSSLGIVQTGIPLPVTGKKMPFSEPQPVKALPMRYKDNATNSIQYVDVDQGLSNSYIYALHEDTKGNLWMGTDGTGLCKYDGISFINYTEKEGLVKNTVLSITEDRQKRLWLATEGGVSCFDGKNFTSFTELEGLLSNQTQYLYTDKKENLWICSLKGISKYDGKNITHYSRKEGLSCNIVYSCLEDRKGNIWMATDSGVFKFDGNLFIQYSLNDGLLSNIVYVLNEDDIGNIWFGFYGKGLGRFDGTTITYYKRKDGMSGDFIRSFLNDNKGNIWIGTIDGGLNKFDGKKFTPYSLQQGLSSLKIREIIEDRNGNIWIGTEGGGINKLNATNFEYSFSESLVENNRIRPILKDRSGHLWFGTDEGQIGKLETANKANGFRRFVYYKLHKNSPYGQRSLEEDKNGNIWIGTTGAGIIKYDGNRFLKYSLGNDPGNESIFDIINDKNGNTWFGTNAGSIAGFDGKNFSFYTTKNGLPGSIIYSMLEDRKGNIWFCTKGAGVYKYDGANIICYSEKEGLFNKSITSITEDDKGNIWLGTLGSGVCRFDGNSFTYYSEMQGLAHNNVWSVFCDKKNQVWIGTDKGLSLCIQKNDSILNAKNNYIFYNFGAQDGLKAIDFNLHSVSVDNDNRIMWGTGKSVPFLDLNKGFHPHSVQITGLSYIEVNEKFIDFRNLQDSTAKKISFGSIAPFQNFPDGLTLAYDQNHLTFHFSAIDWSAPDKVQYSYRLIGTDANWSSPSSNTFTDYRNLRHGNYELQVKAIGRSLIWTKPVSYSFSILPPWWLTWWFKSLLGLILLTVIFLIARFIYRYQLRKQKIVLEKQLAVQFERQRISSEMHDDIGAGLSGIKLMTEMARMKSNDEANTSEIEKIYQSVGDISSKMKEVIWSLNTENDSLSSLIAYLQKQARQMMENYPGKFFMTTPEIIPEIKISGEARRHIHLLIKEALHNIIKHSGASHIELTVSCDDKLKIVVADNGKGMDTAMNNKTGNGMKNMRKRVQQLNGILFIESNNGLKLTFEIPLK